MYLTLAIPAGLPVSFATAWLFEQEDSHSRSTPWWVVLVDESQVHSSLFVDHYNRHLFFDSSCT